MSGVSDATREYQRGREEMKAEIVAALRAAHARDTANDECERDTACAQCEDWYRAIETAERCKV